MNKAHKEKCLKWCLDNQNQDWSMVIFTDESYFQLFRNKVQEWAKSRPQKPTPKHRPSFMVWGGIGTRETTTLEIARGSINATWYQDILAANLEPSLAVIYPDRYVLQQGTATPHKAKSTKKRLEDCGIVVLEWPPYSLDLNPIENLWHVMKDALEKLDPRNMEE
jgi:hypothetical protein